VPNGPRGQDLTQDHAADPGEPFPLAEQVTEKLQAEKVGLRRAFGRLLLEDKANAQQHGCHQRNRVVHGANLPAEREITYAGRGQLPG
jgi:hypothetical protein